ncbi:GNAT family N-acetyltransferase [Roseobacter sp. CCS2]|uniref:GNAT family N-acetyltransferase n=1 Tax=Roseobacter sp. CCS2 TaxID=391593 RepID=UPI0000F402A2|nr:GNAT family N-acetyltransferase [Roseobacter sp. CCS2]EBA13183.1 GCN5-related N-acetyltransferase [Roseobacter sp. CCS2]
MSDIPETATIETKRLRLEPFAESHAASLNAINTEPQVIAFLSDGPPEILEDTLQTIKRVRERWRTVGYSWWAIIETASDKVIGAACLQHVANKPDAELEIGWRLAKAANGNGYATEAGKAAADYAFDVIGVDHIVSVADQRNTASHRVMERVGMRFRGIETHYDAPYTTYVMHRSDRPA